MKGTKYPIVERLQPTAKAIKNFADEQNISVAWVYIKYIRGKADYKIVNFQGINFVIPN